MIAIRSTNLNVIFDSFCFRVCEPFLLLQSNSQSSPASLPSSSIALRMIFGTWRSYFISWQIFENKVWWPVSKKRKGQLHFLLSLAHPIDRIGQMGIVQCCNIVPLLEKVDIWAFILPRNFPAVLNIFKGWGGAGNPTLPTVRGGASIPDIFRPNPKTETTFCHKLHPILVDQTPVSCKLHLRPSCEQILKIAKFL